jgi:hypothetical protein
MKKNIIFYLIMFVCLSSPAFAEKIPIKIMPAELLSTKQDEIEVGDLINFQIKNDVYLNDRLYIKQGTKIIGIVNFVHNNGWGGDNAEITIEKFVTKDINGRKIEINSPIIINGNSETANSFLQVLSAKIFIWLRGSEIYLRPLSQTFNIFIER